MLDVEPDLVADGVLAICDLTSLRHICGTSKSLRRLAEPVRWLEQWAAMPTGRPRYEVILDGESVLASMSGPALSVLKQCAVDLGKDFLRYNRRLELTLIVDRRHFLSMTNLSTSVGPLRLRAQLALLNMVRWDERENRATTLDRPCPRTEEVRSAIDYAFDVNGRAGVRTFLVSNAARTCAPRHSLVGFRWRESAACFEFHRGISQGNFATHRLFPVLSDQPLPNSPSPPAGNDSTPAPREVSPAVLLQSDPMAGWPTHFSPSRPTAKHPTTAAGSIAMMRGRKRTASTYRSRHQRHLCMMAPRLLPLITPRLPWRKQMTP
jgi:hypothetical protein